MTETITGKPYKGIGMKGPVARWYAANAVNRMNQFRSWAQRVSRLATGRDILEVAPGPGYFSIELARRGDFRIAALDISETFVEIARKNAATGGVSIDFRQGNASQMPFANESFDFVFCSAAFKNFTEPVGALREMHRVLRPGGKALIIDLRKDASSQSIDREIAKTTVNWLNALVIGLTFRFMLLKRAYTRSQFEQFAAQTNFRSIEIDEETIALEILLTK